MEWLALTPPMVAIAIAVATRNVYWALGMAIWLSETLVFSFNPAMGALASIDRAVGVFGSVGNTRILLFCLLIGSMIAYMQRSGGINAMVEKLHRTGLASTPRRAGLITALSGVVIFVETNVSLLASGVLGRPLFDRLKVSRERLAYIIDSTCSPISVLILFNGWGAYIAGLMASNGVADEFSVLLKTVALNFYPLITVALVFVTVGVGRTFGPLAMADASWKAPEAATEPGADDTANSASGRAYFMGVPVLILIGGTIGFMIWTGDGDITQGSGSQSVLWAVVLATAAACLFMGASGQAKGESVSVGFKGIADLMPAVTVIFLSLALGDSLRALGTGDVITSVAQSVTYPFLIPAILFMVAGITSFTTGTSWGTYGILVPVAIPMALGADLPMPLVVAAVMGGGVFGDHCSPISDSTIIASLAAGCEHMDHVRTQLPYALVAGTGAVLLYVVFALIL